MDPLTLRHLDLSEMHTVTGDWLGAHKKELHAIPEVVPLIPQIEGAHAAVASAQPVPASGVEEQVSAIFKEQRAVDVRHDHAVRAIFYSLLARSEAVLVEEAPDTELAAKIAAVSTALLPEGLSAVTDGFAVEAGTAARALALVGKDAGIEAILKQTLIAKGVNAHDVLETWAALGKKLGDLETKKVALQKEAAGKPSSGGRGDILQARNEWIGVMQMVLKVMARSKAKPEPLKALRDVVEGVAGKANARYAAERKRETKGQTPPTGSSTGGSTPPAAKT